MLTLARNRILQSLLMTMVFTCHHFHIPVRPNEIQSFSWLSDQSVEISRPSFPFHVPWSEIIFQMISGEFLKASEGTLFGDLMKVVGYQGSEA